MRFHLFIILLLIAFHARSQTLEGVVTDELTGTPLVAAGVTNMSTRLATYTDKQGRFSLPAKSGDQIQFTYIGYKPFTNVLPAKLVFAEMKVSMLPQNVELKEFIIHPDYTPYQIDSIKRHHEYSKDLDKQRVKVKGGATGSGVAVDGLIGSLVQQISKSEKKRKKFVNEFNTDEQNRFIDTRYTPELVTSLTGFKEDTLANFMNTYPMAYDYARTASDIEIKMWVRYNYREYIKRDSVRK